MTATSRNDGVTLFRPLLPLEKTFIFDYAHNFGVPYFKDTTPHWSTRGKLRNRLLPLLEEIYGEGCLTNLSNLAVESDECRALLQKVSFGPFMEQIQRKLAPLDGFISLTFKLNRFLVGDDCPLWLESLERFALIDEIQIVKNEK